MRVARQFLAIQAVVFAAAALLHGGVFVAGYEHREARIAESVIAVVLALGLVVAVVQPSLTRPAALAAQAFALLGTIVGVVMIAIGVGPRSGLDLLIHATMLTLLIAGLLRVSRQTRPAR